MKVLGAARTLLGRLLRPSPDLPALSRRLDDLKVLCAQPSVRAVRSAGLYDHLREAEFQVFSQFGDDGIIQYLIGRVKPDADAFIELGVEDYTESNTRFLLVNDNWRGLVVDASGRHVAKIRRSKLSWRHDLTAVHAFLTRENVNDVIATAGFAGPIGLLSIDVDGNDYWLWEALTAVQPALVVAEYNSLFGPDRALAVPYRADFERTRAHGSNLYWGCSLRALCDLAHRRGYVFAGCNRAGNNAYFVGGAHAGAVRTHTVQSGFVAARFRQARDDRGELTYVSGVPQQRRLIEHLPVLDLETGRVRPLRDALAREG